MISTKKQIEERIHSYIIFEKDLKEALLKNMVPISIVYKNDFRLQDDFLKPYLSNYPEIEIVIETKQVAVSYTHLDVYKRQSMNRLILKIIKKF